MAHTISFQPAMGVEDEMSKGIDYSMGTANYDPKTGIRYGIVPLGALNDFALEAFEAQYDGPFCPVTGNEIRDCDEPCPHCEAERHEPEDCYPDEPSCWTYEGEGYSLMLDSSNDVWVFKSPFVARAGFCSPCALGAVYLTSVAPDGALAYALGPSWYGDEAPMPYEPSLVAMIEVGEETYQNVNR